MAYTFPLPLSDFFDGLPITSVDFDLPEALAMSQTGGGDILTADLGDRLWKVDVVVPLQYYRAAEAIKAKLHMLRYAGRSLIVHQMPIIAPAYDPNGVILGGIVPNLNAVHANNRDLKIGNLPVGYKLSPGDGLSFTYGSNPTRYAFHQIVQGGTAGAGGITPYIEVVPFIQPGYALASVVKLIKPEFKAVVMPGTFKPGTSGRQITDGIVFSLIQTLRA